jgi:type VI secretion system secreted protein Hcp
MAVDMFLKLEPVKGEAQDKTHKEEMDILSWSWGMNQTGGAHTGSGAGAGKVQVQDLSVTKWVDKATPNLMQSCAMGKTLDQGILTVRKAGGTSPVEYLKITMTEVIVTQVQTGGSQGEDKLTENVTLNFRKFKFEYTEQDAKGGKGTTSPFGWDIAANAEEA